MTGSPDCQVTLPPSRFQHELALRVLGTEHDGRILRIQSPKCTIGSAAGCTLRLRAPGVQDVHCLVLRGPGGLVVRSWSTDTRLNGQTFVDAPLSPGDRLAVGPVELEVLDTSMPAPAVFHSSPVEPAVDNARWQQTQQEAQAAIAARDALARRVAEREEHVARLSAQLSETERLVEQLKREVSETPAIDPSAGKVTQLEQQLQALRNDLAAAETARSVDQTLHAEERDTLKQSLAQAIAELDQYKVQAAHDHARLAADLEKATLASIANVEQQREHREREVALTHWRERSDEQRLRIAELERQLTELQSPAPAAADASPLRAELEAAARELDAETERLLEREQELETKLQEWEAEKQQVAAELTARQAALAQEQAALQNERIQLQQQTLQIGTADALAAERAALTQLATELNEERSTLEQQTAALTQQRETLAAQQAELLTARQQLTALQQEHQRLVADQQELQARQEAAVESQRRALAEQQLVLTTQQDELTARLAAVAEQQHALAEQQAALATQQAELHASRRQLTTQQEEHDLLVADQQELQARQVAADSAASELLAEERDALTALAAEIEQQRTALAAQTVELDAAREALAAQQQTIAAQHEELAARLAAVAEQQQTLAEQQTALQQEQQQLQTEREELARLQATAPGPHAITTHEEPTDVGEPDAEPAAPFQPPSASDIIAKLSASGLWKDEVPHDDEPAATKSPEPAWKALVPEQETRPAAPVPASDEEDSIEAYMQRLLQRVSGDSDSSSRRSIASHSAPAVVAKPTETQPAAPEPAPVVAEEAPFDFNSYVPRTAPELTANLAAMRELANTSARTAIDSSSKRKQAKHATSKIVLSLGAIGTAVALGWLSLRTHSMLSYYAALSAGAASLLWGLHAGYLWLKARRHHSSTIAESHEAEG